MDVATVISLVTGGIGSCGTVVSAWLAIERHRDTKPRLRVLLTFGSAQLTSTGTVRLLDTRPGNPPARELLLTVMNKGRQMVALGMRGFELPSGAILYLDDEPASHQLPHALAPGERTDACPSAAGIARDLSNLGMHGTIRLVGFYADQLGNTYRSKPITLDIDEWVKKQG